MINYLISNTINIAEVNDDFTILWILLSGILVFFMQAGFTLVESGFTRSKNAVNISMKNILDISVGTISFWALGYGLMYGDTNGYIATSGLLFNPGDGAHDVFFQTVFCATAATIVSGAITLGFVQQIVRAFSRVETSLQYLVRSWPIIVELISVYRRLNEFEKRLDLKSAQKSFQKI